MLNMLRAFIFRLSDNIVIGIEDGDCPQCGNRHSGDLFPDLRCFLWKTSGIEASQGARGDIAQANEARNTPIGALHRLIWLHIPGGFRRIDQKLTNGRLSTWLGRLAHKLWNDRHPLVMVRIHINGFLPSQHFYIRRFRTRDSRSSTDLPWMTVILLPISSIAQSVLSGLTILIPCCLSLHCPYRSWSSRCSNHLLILSSCKPLC